MSRGNPRTRKAHRIQVFFQIVLPLLLGTALATWGLLALVNGRTGNLTSLSQIATMVLAIPVVLIGLVVLLLVVALIFLLGRLMHWLPPRTAQVQRGMNALSSRVVAAADGVAKPVIAAESWLNAINNVIRRRS
jgi:hypothetical protein